MTDFSPIVQLWFNTVLIWIGFGTLAGLMAQVLLPKGKPTGLYGILVVGVCGSCVGVFLIDAAAKSANIDEFSSMNPIGPVGLFVSVAVSFVILIFYRLVLLIMSCCSKKAAKNSAHTTSQQNNTPQKSQNTPQQNSTTLHEISKN